MHQPTRTKHNPFCFVVGCPRSGTTLLQRMLDHHPDLAVANDTHFVPRALEKTAPHLVERAVAGERIPLSQVLVDAVVGYRRFHRLGLDEQAGRELAMDRDNYADYSSALYDSFAARQGKLLGGEKTPDYVRRLPLLFGLFPSARVIHIIRDGRDVALSTLDWATGSKGPGKLELWNSEPLATCALWWRWQVLEGRRAGRTQPARYIEVRYESLVEQPEKELKRLCEFLDLSMSNEMLDYHVGRTRSDRGSAKSNWLPPTAGLRDWRKQMSPRDVELFELLAGDLLKDLGLERINNRIDSNAAARAATCREWWAQFLERRARKRERRSAQALEGALR